MMTEWILIALVAFLAFGPKKLPELARHLGIALRWLLQIKAGLERMLQSEIKQQLLHQANEKAQAADKIYQEAKQTSNTKNIG